MKSYDTKLIGRLHRTQRALKQQDLNNMRLIKDLRGKGIDRTLKMMSSSYLKNEDKASIGNAKKYNLSYFDILETPSNDNVRQYWN